MDTFIHISKLQKRYYNHKHYMKKRLKNIWKILTSSSVVKHYQVTFFFEKLLTGRPGDKHYQVE
jgi:hypothetical protein